MPDVTLRETPCGTRFMRKRRLVSRVQHEDPMASMANLFDAMLLLAVGLFIMALSSYGLGGLLTKKDFSLVTNHGKNNETIVTKHGSQITTLKRTNSSVTGVGQRVGSIFNVNGDLVYVPGQ